MYQKHDRVEVLREVRRLPETRNKSWDPAASGPYCSLPELYAKEGEVGTVLEIFRAWQGTWHAKVLISGKVKTFRLTSLRRISK